MLDSWKSWECGARWTEPPGNRANSGLIFLLARSGPSRNQRRSNYHSNKREGNNEVMHGVNSPCAAVASRLTNSSSAGLEKT